MSDQISKIIEKIRAMLPLIKDEDLQKKTKADLDKIIMFHNVIMENNTPCPPELELELNQQIIAIEQLYNQFASN